MQARPALARAEGPHPHILKMFLTHAKFQICRLYGLNKWLFSVPHYIEQTVFDVSNWKLPLRVRFPHVPIFNCRRRTNCENFDVENKKVKFALLEASEINFASIAANLFEFFSTLWNQKKSQNSAQKLALYHPHIDFQFNGLFKFTVKNIPKTFLWLLF